MGLRGILLGKAGGKRPLGIPRHKWEDNIKIYLREIGWGRYGVDSSGSDQSRALLNTVMNLWVP
jgi:hypothetical protein